MGKADIPTPPNNNNKNHPKNAIEPIQNIGKDTLIFIIVLSRCLYIVSPEV